MNKVTEVSRHKAKLNGRIVRLKPVTTKTLRAGKWYIRFYSNYASVCYLRGQPFNNVGHSKDPRDRELRKNHPEYRNAGKVNIRAVYESEFGNDGWHRICYLSDLGVQDVKHPSGAVLFEFSHKAIELLRSLNKDQADKILGYPDPTWDWHDFDYDE